MKTIVVPVDFSKTSVNAAKYAIELGAQLSSERIILFHTYNYLNVSDPLMGYEQAITIDRYKDASEKQLSEMKEMLEKETGCSELEAFTRPGDLEEGVAEICESQKADLVVMGITGGSMLKETLIGSNTIKTAKHITVPLLIIPPDASYVPIEEVMLACDFKKVEETVPIEPIQKLLKDSKATFFVLHVAENDEDGRLKNQQEEQKLAGLFKAFSPKVHYRHSVNLVDGINGFANEYEVDIIIVIPKKHGWFEKLLSPTHTTRLAFHTHVPLLLIHD